MLKKSKQLKTQYMNNDNIQNACTGECSLCETCIYDQVIPDDNKTIEKSDGKYCNGCPYVKYRYSTTNYLNWECTKATCEGIPKFIGFNVKLGSLVETPDWCPRKNVSSHKKWEDIKPMINFDEIKAGQCYHIPPIKNKKRRDIIIYSKFETCFSYQLVDSNDASLKYIYKKDVDWRFMTKQKKLGK